MSTVKEKRNSEEKNYKNSPVPNSMSPIPRKVIIHAETRRRRVRGDVFYYKLFYSASLRLRVQKNILPENGRISLVNN
jgi:hypothetical protein